jgi:hypothetical protein
MYVYGLKESGGSYEQWPNDMYVVEMGRIFDYDPSNPNDEVDDYELTMSDEDATTRTIRPAPRSSATRTSTPA